MGRTNHIPVLLNEVIHYLDPKPGENFIDATIGEAGHSLAILKRIKPKGKVLGIDADKGVLEKLESRLKNRELRKRLIIVQGNFRDLKKIIEENNFKEVRGILFDLGLSSWQLKESGRGFSFQKDEPLLMNYKSRIGNDELTAEMIVNRWPEKELFKIFKEYGEEKYSRKIAKKIIKVRKEKNIKTTGELRELVKRAVPVSKSRRGKINKVLARIFQALRIAVNNELEDLKEGLEQGLEILEPGGRLVVISFHSLEDKIVKQFFREKAKHNFLKILTKKPIRASEKEIKYNPRSRSAKLRAVIKR